MRIHPAGPIYFVSDLHLGLAIPNTVAAFEHFVTTIANEAGAVYILGDLFEYWVGDDMLNQPLGQYTASLLRTFAERQIPLYLMHGNRDFLLGQRFVTAAQAQLIDDPYTLHVFDQRIVLTHGDTLCTEDRAYQRFRRVVRCRAMQRFFMAWPLHWRIALAARIHAKSKRQALADRDKTGNDAKDVTATAVAQLFAASSTTRMIHGHTHRPATHSHGDTTRWVLPDWDFDHGQRRGGYLRLDEKGIDVLPIHDLSAIGNWKLENRKDSSHASHA